MGGNGKCNYLVRYKPVESNQYIREFINLAMKRASSVNIAGTGGYYMGQQLLYIQGSNAIKEASHIGSR